MTDELSIQQKRPSALPYLGVGAAAGGLGAYYGLPHIEKVNQWMTEPAKYSSYEELINEAEDTFKKAVESAEGEEKTLMEKAAQARQAGIDAGAKWDADLKAFQEAYKPGELATLPESHEAVKAYNAKRQELINQEIEKLSKAPTEGSKTISQHKLLKSKAEKIYRATTEAQRLEAVAELDKACEALAEKYTYAGDAEAVKAAKEAMKKELKAHTEEMVAMMDINKAAPTQPKIVRDYVAKKAQLAKLETGISEATERLSHTTGLDLKGYVVGDKVDSMLNRRLQSIAKSETTMIETLEGLKGAYNKASGPEMLSFRERLLVLLTGEAPAKGSGDVMTRLVKDLNPQQKAQLEKLLKEGELSAELFDNAIKSHTENVKNIKEAVDTIFENQEKIYGKKGLRNAVAKDLKTIRSTYHDVGAYVDKEGILRKADGSAIVDKAAKKEASKIKLPAGVTEPKGGVTLERSVTAMTKEEIAEQAARNIDSKAGELLKAEQAAVNEARQALGKNGAKTAEELTKEFIEKHGTRQSVVESAQNSFKDDLANLFKGKRGGKFWGVVAGTAAATALIALAFRPSNKQA